VHSYPHGKQSAHANPGISHYRHIICQTHRHNGLNESSH